MRFWLILGCLVFFAWAQTRPTLAVLDLRAAGTLSADEVSVLTARLESEVLRLGRFRVLERTQMAAILREQGFQQSGICDSKECQIQVGQLLGVSYLLTGAVGRVGNITTMDIRVIDVETGEIVHSESRDVRGGLEELLLTTCRDLAQTIVVDPSGRVLRHAAPAGAAEPPKASVEPEKSRNWWLWGGLGVVAAAVSIYVVLAPPRPGETVVRREVVRTTALGYAPGEVP